MPNGDRMTRDRECLVAVRIATVITPVIRRARRRDAVCVRWRQMPRKPCRSEL